MVNEYESGVFRDKRLILIQHSSRYKKCTPLLFKKNKSRVKQIKCFKYLGNLDSRYCQFVTLLEMVCVVVYLGNI